MGGTLVGLIVLNCFIFSFIFWLLTFFSKIFYVSKYKNYKLDFYECGFQRTSFLKVNYSIQYILLSTFLILYDGELLLLYPVFMDLVYTSNYIITVIFFFIFLLVLAVLVDYLYSTLDWVL